MAVKELIRAPCPTNPLIQRELTGSVFCLYFIKNLVRVRAIVLFLTGLTHSRCSEIFTSVVLSIKTYLTGTRPILDPGVQWQVRKPRFQWSLSHSLSRGFCFHTGFPGGSVVKKLPANAGDKVRSLDQEDSLEEEIATDSSIPAWKIPRTVESGWLQSMGHKESDTTE